MNASNLSRRSFVLQWNMRRKWLQHCKTTSPLPRLSQWLLVKKNRVPRWVFTGTRGNDDLDRQSTLFNNKPLITRFLICHSDFYGHRTRLRPTWHAHYATHCSQRLHISLANPAFLSISLNYHLVARNKFKLMDIL